MNANRPTPRKARGWFQTHLTVRPREHATILAALRFWQSEFVQCERPDLAEIADEHGRRLNTREIDGLCERINR